MTRKVVHNDKERSFGMTRKVVRNDTHNVILSETKNPQKNNNRLNGTRDMYYVYLLTNKHNTVLYTGVTNDLRRRIYEHKNQLIEGFTKRYNINKLVYFEYTTDVKTAIEREKQIKGWTRKKKNDLIETMNPEWKDLSLE